MFKFLNQLAFFKDHAEAQSLSGVSWIYQGTAQQNNSALTFNLYDTLNLICRATGASIGNSLIYVVSKGTIPTGMTLSSAGALTVKNIGTLIYSDVDGIQKGYENFVIYTGGCNIAVSGTVQLGSKLIYDYRYVSVGALKTTDSASYICSAAYIDAGSLAAVDNTTPTTYQTSGAVSYTHLTLPTKRIV